MEEALRHFFENNGLAVLYIGTVAVLIMCGMGLPFPEEATFLIAGFAGHKLGADLPLLCVLGVLGIMVGDSIPFLIGHKYGMDFLTHKIVRKAISPKNIERTQSFFRTHGSKTIFIARFVAGLRMPTFFMAGTMGVKYWTFFMWNLLGALISCPVSIWLAYKYGDDVKHWLEQSKIYVAIAIAAGVAYIVYHYWSHREKAGATPSQPPLAGVKTPEAIQEPAVEKDRVEAK